MSLANILYVWQLVLEYSKKEQECETLRKKVDSCKEESNYYTNKSSDLAHEFNALLDAFQQVCTKQLYALWLLYYVSLLWYMSCWNSDEFQKVVQFHFLFN